MKTEIIKKPIIQIEDKKIKVIGYKTFVKLTPDDGKFLMNKITKHKYINSKTNKGLPIISKRMHPHCFIEIAF